jgi:hypothetical protein
MNNNKENEIKYLVPSRVETRMIFFAKTIGVIELIILAIGLVPTYLISFKLLPLLGVYFFPRLIIFIIAFFISSVFVLDLTGSNTPGWKYLLNVYSYYKKQNRFTL